jgi:hypothetical protein
MNRYNAAGGVDGVSMPLGISTLATALEPTYSKNIPKRDGWGRPFTCYIDADWGATSPATRYVIISPGSDGVFSSAVASGPFHNFDCDIIYSNGQFITYPEGTQVTSKP